MNGTGRNMYVFRDGRATVCGRSLVADLAVAVRNVLGASGNQHVGNLLIDALLRAGELECALADLHSPETPRLAQLTDRLAQLLVGVACRAPAAEELLALLPPAVPETLQLSPPEGFAFYALHPLDFADLAAGLQLGSGFGAVIGIRSIGTTLSAIVTAALQKRGVRASRVTVRPTGHPYDRRTDFDSAQLRWIAAERAQQAEFLVVDEGPGMSGSSFLSAGEALLGAGVARSRIQFLCSREPDVDALCARDAALRWRSFRASYSWHTKRYPQEAKIYVGGGYWRNELLPMPSSNWPASWSQMERLKFLSPDRRVLYKFEGFGRFGAGIVGRAQRVADAGFSAAPFATMDGFACYHMFDGRSLWTGDLDTAILDRLAEYCAFRVREFRCEDSASNTASQMETMLRFNTQEEFGVELNGALGPLHTDNPLLVDGRMQPHEWVRTRSGEIMKCDVASHGDDHFFPGPATDIAWDIAGAITEWDMDRAAADYLVSAYLRRTGDDARSRLRPFLLAYAVFRMAYCKMAAEAMRDSEEERRLLRDYLHYRERAASMLPSSRDPVVSMLTTQSSEHGVHGNAETQNYE